MNIAVPTLDALAADPRQVAQVPAEAIPILLAQTAAVQAALAARLLASPNGQPPDATAEDRLLTPKEAADTLRVTLPWIYRHAKRLPFTRRLSRKALRFSEAGLRRWQAARRS